jgi:hypothetical protein
MRCPIHPATQTPSALGVAVRSWVSVCAVGASAAFAASPPQQAVDVEAQLNVLSRLEARTLQLDTECLCGSTSKVSHSKANRCS